MRSVFKGKTQVTALSITKINTKKLHILQPHFTLGDKMGKNEMGGACSAYGEGTGV
jgi:hypothetical protein